MEKEYIFVDYQKGVYDTPEGKKVAYDNLILSDGLESFKVKNQSNFPEESFKRGDRIMVLFDVIITKGLKGNIPTLVVKSVS